MLDAALASSIQRLERIENKAMGTLLGVALAFAVFGTASGLLGEESLLAGQSQGVRLVAGMGLMLAMFYLLVSGLLALKAYQVGEVYRPTLADAVPAASPEDAASATLFCTEQNDRVSTMRSNTLVAAFACLRNGLVLVFILFGMMVVLFIWG